jgi:hypothetical protein
MTDWQQIFIAVYGLMALIFFIAGLYHCLNGKSYGKWFGLNIIGAFVWGDAIIFGLFWAIVASMFLYFQNWLWFLIVLSAFWLIRSIGETIYWFLNQFIPLKHNKPENFFFYRLVRNDSVYFIAQIWWQCLTTAFLVLLIYLITLL